MITHKLSSSRAGHLPEGTNDTLLVLIPKTSHPEQISHLRPISLCNVAYKVITKTMTNTSNEIMESSITPNQSSFILGRQIVDNIIIYQEVLHSIKKLNSRKNYMLIKVNLEKAYDRLSWSFIQDMLEQVGLPISWIRNIMHCVGNLRMAIN